MTLQNEDLAFAEISEKMVPLLERMNDLLKTGRISLKNQHFRIEQNHLAIVDQEKKIAENRKLIEDAKGSASSILAMAEERVKELERGASARIAEANHVEREAKKMKEEAEKILWNAQEKKKVKA